ncbi:MAG: NusG domain II-containing protein [Lachnospiraceae bacterium]|nr:NusG domain II-containing protein [Lachnospiraceae bacterium]
MNKKDVILILLLVAVSAIFLIPSSSKKDGEDAYIYVNGQLYGKYDLSEPQSIHIENPNGIVNDIDISDGYIFMKNATCPQKQCMACGHINHRGQSICCAPAGLMVIIKDTSEDAYDAVTK